MATQDRLFLEWLDQWYDLLSPVDLQREVIVAAGGPERVGILVVDLIVGFCSSGPLASPRVGALGAPTAEFLTAAWGAGVRNLVIAADAHPADSPEFKAFPPHCIVDTAEAEMIPELTGLPFFAESVVIPKRSLNVGLEPAFEDWLRDHPQTSTWIVVGDCTDLCVYHAAMHLRMRANVHQLDLEVIVPAALVETYDLPVGVAVGLGALPHAGDFLGRAFLYHMALNGIRVVREVTV